MFNNQLPESVSDEELMSLISKDSEPAFETLYIRYAEALTGFAMARLASAEEAGDMVHDLFVHFWEQRHQISIHSNVRGFLFASVRYRIIDHIRKSAVRERYAKQLESFTGVVPATQQELEAKEMEIRIRKIAHDLSPRVREVFFMSRFDYLSVDEIAARLGTSSQTIKNQLTTAISFIRSRLISLVALLLFLQKNI